MGISEFYLLVGFVLAGYAVIANDSIQTLGTFLTSNKNVKWYWLLAYTASIMWVVLIAGWYLHGGDLAWGRLETIPFPQNVTILHALAPLVLIFLTNFGIPVSATFLVLSVFATRGTIEAMVLKSASGYIVAFIVAVVLWYILSFIINEKRDSSLFSRGFWSLTQWIATGFLWSQWLIQDMANIAVFLPRQTPFITVIFVLIFLTFLLGIIFRRGGGKIQEIVNNKLSTHYIRSATIIDISLGLILYFFKELSSIPMSTTWVFIGLLAGRQFILGQMYRNKEARKRLFPSLILDFTKIIIGLVISIGLAVLVAYYS